MQTFRFCSAGGQTYHVQAPAARKHLTSAYLFSFHKSGSTLMDNMVRQYCEYFNIPTFSLFNAAFDAGIPTSEIMDDTLVCFTRTGRIYTGFRHYPKFDLDLAGLPVVLLVRDPRDMLVSLYYSLTKSHVIPERNEQLKMGRKEAALLDIDQFALKKARTYLNNFHRYQRKLPARSLITYRYEDVIYEKNAWLHDLVRKLGLPFDSNLIARASDKFDVFPEKEDTSKHIRQVHPGNYRTRLGKETIRILNKKLRDFLEFYKYD